MAVLHAIPGAETQGRSIMVPRRCHTVPGAERQARSPMVPGRGATLFQGQRQGRSIMVPGRGATLYQGQRETGQITRYRQWWQGTGCQTITEAGRDHTV
ncbi:hypothetical protein XELAEV_18044243mg [Xenopus laevis]|uniref:Uncharacterized protein n=1 Tax=Xenopus laevis TaxID=8355 RepID=A0A974BYK2_XENLA|nr:hypothetical protein XELAEV_18044243mg [Xenopus laevis]